VSDYVYAPKQDANHGDVTKWYEDLYCLVRDTHKLGASFPDLLVRISTKRGHVLNLVEVKTADGTLTKAQQTFMRDWGPGCVAVVQSREDVFAHVERVRSGL
jgi:hypothetical protein